MPLVLHLDGLDVLKLSIQVSLESSRMRILPLRGSLNWHQLLPIHLHRLIAIGSSSLGQLVVEFFLVESLLQIALIEFDLVGG